MFSQWNQEQGKKMTLNLIDRNCKEQIDSEYFVYDRIMHWMPMGKWCVYDGKRKVVWSITEISWRNTNKIQDSI